LEKYQAEIEAQNAPFRERMTVVEELLEDNKAQLGRLLDLYLAGDFSKDMLMERKRRLEETVAALDKEHSQLAATLDAQILTDDQMRDLEQFREKVSQGFEYAEDNYEERRRIVDMLDVQVTLDYQDDEMVIDAECRLGKSVVSLASPSTGPASRAGRS
jgi:hypothetical protein